MKQAPFFSIITCTYNSGRYLPNNIKSIRSQTYKDFEHIFIDAYSTDKTRQVISAYSKSNPKFIKMFYQMPQGISKAMNLGIKKATGKYLIHLHSDDSFFDTKVLQDVHGFLIEHPYLDWLYGKINVRDIKGSPVGVFPNKLIYRLFPRLIIKYLNVIPHQGVFIKKNVFLEHGFFDESLTSSMDLDLWFRIINKTKWCFYNRIIANFLIRKDAQSSGLKRKPENDKNIFSVEKRYLTKLELALFSIAKKIIDRYNKTRL
jgi:glycosyltransferase involved in cell wall biosynthesis